MSVVIETADGVTDELVEAFGRLLPQLSHSAVPLGRAGLGRVVSSGANTLLIARVDGRIVGTLTLVMTPLASGFRALVEDVIVDAEARGHGVGKALVEHALRVAEDAGARTVDLTSRASREAANRLYLRVGFRRRETNVYRFMLGEDLSTR
jgi:ribosomal protein S18 acetylase RimI-like enzyme